MVGMLPYDVAGGDAHFHCNLTWRTGVSGGATPALESAQLAVQCPLRGVEERKTSAGLAACPSWWLRGSKQQGSGLAGPIGRAWMTSHQAENHFLSSAIWAEP